MQSTDRARLTTALRTLVGKIAADLHDQIRAEGPARERARKLHEDEQVGDAFDVWTDLLARRAAVLWVLKSVYVRVLEDRRLLSRGRLIDTESQELFERLAPNLGETAFLRWVYRDLAKPDGGLPELFGPQPAEVAEPSNVLSRELIAFWRHKDADTGRQWSFAEERFEGELMGDLYQELDPVVKGRYALCQTPDFVREFILDRTLTPAIEEFGADVVRLLDPACGSGHFLIDGLKRLVAATEEARPEWDRRTVVTHCLDRVVGIDLNDYACALARARLLMTAADLVEGRSLREAAGFRPHVYWADGLEQVEKGLDLQGHQLDLFDDKKEAGPKAAWTRPEVRSALGKILEARFHAVVANPPFIVERDEARKAYHREKVNGNARYRSAYMLYSLASPFTERCYQLAVRGGFVGLITSNNFMKRSFGRPLIEEMLPSYDLSLIVDTSQAYIPFHGTPTVLLFGRNQPPHGEHVRAVLGKRGETSTPEDPARGRVWASITEGWRDLAFDNEYMSVLDLPRETLGQHPWSLQGGGAIQLKRRLDDAATNSLGDHVRDIGRTTVCGEDDIFIMSPDVAARIAPEGLIMPMTIGEVVRDWSIQPSEFVLYPYMNLGGSPMPKTHPTIGSYLWRYRSLLRARTVFGKSPEERGGRWYEHLEHYTQRLRTPLSIAFAFVATHNHFVFDRGGKVFNRSAPVIKLPEGANEDEHFALLGLLNSSVLGFWMRQVFHVKGGESTGKKRQSEAWSRRLEYDATKLQRAPIVHKHRDRVVKLVAQLDTLAEAMKSHSPPAVLARDWQARDLGRLLESAEASCLAIRKEMVSLQEELDWTVYSAFEIKGAGELTPIDQMEPIASEHRPFAIRLARDAAKGDATHYWFEAMEVAAVTEVPRCYSPATRSTIERRLAAIEANDNLGLLESAEYKRKWEPIHFRADVETAAIDWLANRVEDTLKNRSRPSPLPQIVSAIQEDERFLALTAIYQNRRDVDLSGLVTEILTANSIPLHPYQIYTDSGLSKRAAWEETWQLQRKEDAGEDVGDIPVPPEYSQGSRGKSKDFLRTEYWKLRGKLDVPKERFIAFTEVPGRPEDATLYGWAGWTPLERIRVLLALDEELEDAGVPIADRVGVLDSAWRLLPDAAREDAKAAGRLKAELQALVGPEGPSREMLEDWRERFPPPRSRRKGRKRT